MSVVTGQTVASVFTTTDPTTGEGADATGTPTGKLFVNGVPNLAAVTVSHVAGEGYVGQYSFSVTLPTLNIGDTVAVVITATVNGVTSSGKVWEDACDIRLASGYVGINWGDVANQNTAVDLLQTNVGTVQATLGVNVVQWNGESVQSSQDGIPVVSVLNFYNQTLDSYSYLAADSDAYLSVNLKKVADISVGGAGTSGDPWGPA